MRGEIPEGLACLILNSLPVDITFVDKDDVIRYYSDYRIFNRAPKILGTLVQNCHSLATRPEVDKVIQDLRSRREKVITHISKKGGRNVVVRYCGVYGSGGEYQGMVEVCQWQNEKVAL